MDIFKIICWIVVCVVCVAAQTVKKEETSIYLLTVGIQIVGAYALFFS